jgi:hypothetical protein
MDNSSTTTATLEQTDEEIFTYTVSDEALEAAAGTERGAAADLPPTNEYNPFCIPRGR